MNRTLKNLYFLGMVAEVVIRLPHERQRRRTTLALDRVDWSARLLLGLVFWSPSLQLREGHELVTRGVYRSVRHPMYASMWLWGVAQTLLLQN